MPRSRSVIATGAAWALLAAGALPLSACGSSAHATVTTRKTVSAQQTVLPGTGRPAVTIGDKNFTEQFVLGELYYQVLKAEGFSVQLNQNIGPTEVTLQALQSGSLSMYPEYLDTWDSDVAGDQQSFPTMHDAYEAGQGYAAAHGMQLLTPTPFSDTDAVGVTFLYAVQNRLATIGDLKKVAPYLVFGAPPQFEQASGGLPALEEAYGFLPDAFKALEIGQQYQALDQGTVQAADVNTTDGQLVSGDYTLLRDSKRVLGWGNVVPVVSAQAVAQEGPAFVAVINQVSALLSTDVMRELNAEVDLDGQDPATVARQFLIARGLLPQTTG